MSGETLWSHPENAHLCGRGRGWQTQRLPGKKALLQATVRSSCRLDHYIDVEVCTGLNYGLF